MDEYKISKKELREGMQYQRAYEKAFEELAQKLSKQNEKLLKILNIKPKK